MLKSITGKLSTHTQSIWHKEYYISVDALNWEKGCAGEGVGVLCKRGYDNVPGALQLRRL